MDEGEASEYVFVKLCAICGKGGPPRFWMDTLTDSTGVLYWLYFDTEECVEEYMDYQRKVK